MHNILFLNHKQKQCGVYQYGYMSGEILKKSNKYNFLYREVDSESESDQLIQTLNPVGIVYNYNPNTMGWCNTSVLKKYPNILHFGIHHEGHYTAAIQFDCYITIDPTFTDTANWYNVPRPLIEDMDIEYKIKHSGHLNIGSFGFGFQNKGFQRLVKRVNTEFDNEANVTINLHIPFAYYGDMDGRMAQQIAQECKSYITKPNIKLNITHNFLTNHELLTFLASNDINCFFYDDMVGRGISSVIDYALSVERPIAITNSYMFRHIRDSVPSICIEKSSFMEILNPISDPLRPYKEKWSNAKFIEKCEYIIGKNNL